MSVNFTRDGALGLVQIDRPEKLNALDLKSFDAIERIVGTVENDPSLRAVLFYSSSDRFFSAGADINDLKGISGEEASRRATYRRNVLQRLSELRTPTVAVVDGLAMGGGVELALACTFRLATPRAAFSMPEIRLGLLPGAGATQRLGRLIGESRAIELMLTTRPVGADEALRIGLVNGLIADPLADGRAFAAQWLNFSGTAIRGVVGAVRDGSGLSLREALHHEGRELALLNMSEDGIEGVAAFLEKRPAKFNRS